MSNLKEARINYEIELVKYDTDHMLHFVISLVTLLAWTPIWFLKSMYNLWKRDTATEVYLKLKELYK